MAIQLRRHFVDRDLHYVLSYTVGLNMRPGEIGPVPGGARVNVFTKDGILYQVLNKRAPWAEGNIRGAVLPGGMDWMFLGEDDVGRTDARIAFHTADGAYLEARLRGVISLGSGGYKAWLRGMKISEESRPPEPKGETFLARVHATPLFEASHVRYRWLTELQCAGFGRLKVVGGAFTELTMDVYALS